MVKRIYLMQLYFSHHTFVDWEDTHMKKHALRNASHRSSNSASRKASRNASRKASSSASRITAVFMAFVMAATLSPIAPALAEGDLPAGQDQAAGQDQGQDAQATEGAAEGNASGEGRSDEGGAGADGQDGAEGDAGGETAEADADADAETEAEADDAGATEVKTADDQERWADTSTDDGVNVTNMPARDSKTDYNAQRFNEVVDAFTWSYTGLPQFQTGDSTEPTQGSGTVDDPYLVYTGGQLKWALVNNKSVKLMSDIDLGGRTGQNWRGDEINLTAAGVFDGNGHSIYNLYSNNGGYRSALIARWTTSTTS